MHSLLKDRVFSGCTHSHKGQCFQGVLTLTKDRVYSLKGWGVFRVYSLSQGMGCFQGVLTLKGRGVFSDRVFSGCTHSLNGQGVFRVYSLSQRTGCFQGVLTLLKDCGVLAAKC